MRQIIILLFLLVFSVISISQEMEVQDKITLNSGEIYVGKIILQNSEIVMIVNSKGDKFQFQLSEIKNINTETTATYKATEAEYQNFRDSSNFGGMIELSGGVSSAKNSFLTSPNAQLSLIFGNKNAFKQNIFLGLGIGYNNTFIGSQNRSFLPIFIKVQNAYSKKRISPYISMDLGYSLGLQPGNLGGLLAKISFGLAHRISYKSVFLAGFYAGTQGLSGNLIEQNPYGSFSYIGKTSMNNVGLKVGLTF